MVSPARPTCSATSFRRSRTATGLAGNKAKEGPKAKAADKDKSATKTTRPAYGFANSPRSAATSSARKATAAAVVITAPAIATGCLMSVPGGFGFHAELAESEGASAADAMFRERHRCALVSTRPKAHMPLANFVERGREFTAEAIGRVTARGVRIRWMGETLLEAETLQLNQD